MKVRTYKGIPVCQCGQCEGCVRRKKYTERQARLRGEVKQFPCKGSVFECSDGEQFEDELTAYKHELLLHNVVLPEEILVFLCSDNQYFTTELHAANHELQLFRRGRGCNNG